MIYRYSQEKQKELLDKAAEVLLGGGVALLPTETVYGLFALAESEQAQRRIFEIKKRPENRVLSLTLDSPGKIKHHARVEPWQEAVLNHFLPGPVTFVLGSETPLTEFLVTREKTVGIRIPDVDFIRQLIKLTGPLASTSANFSGEPSPAAFSQIKSDLIKRVDFALDAGTCRLETPTTVYDLTFKPGRVIRAGAVEAEEIRRIIDARG